MTRHAQKTGARGEPSGRWLRRALRVLPALAIGVAAGGMLAEAGTRLLYPVARGGTFTWAEARARLHSGVSLDDLTRGDRTRTAGFSQGEILHPYLGWAMDPSAAILQNGREKRPYSRLGFLGGDISPVGEDEIVVGISGGSVAGGFWLEGSRDLRNALLRDPRFRGKRIRIENFALAGYKQPQALLTLAHLLVQGGRFDIWINLDGFNEVALPLSENLPAGVASVYPRSWQVLARGAPAPGKVQWRAEHYAAMDRRERWRRRIAHSVVSRSAFVVAGWDLVDQRHERRIRAIDARFGALRPAPEANAAVQGPNHGQPPLGADDVLRQSVEIWMNASIQMARLCEANGIAYFQFLQPNQYRAGSKSFSEEERRTALALGGYRPAAERGYPMLVDGAKQLRAQGVPITDLTMIFEDEPRTIYRDSCCHVNELGNELMARRVAQTILEAPPR